MRTFLSLTGRLGQVVGRQMFALALVLTAGVACGRQPAEPEGMCLQPFRLMAQQESDATRTILSPDDPSLKTIAWLPGDAIQVFNEGGSGVLTCTDGAAVTKADFEGTVSGSFADAAANGGPIWGLYPATKQATFNEGVITTTLPCAQESAENTFANGLCITLGYSETGTETDASGNLTGARMTFRHGCSGLRFQLERSDIHTVTFIANGGEALAGTVSYTLDENAVPYVKDVTSAASEVVLTAPEGKCFAPGTWYYLVMLPATLEYGYTIHLEGDGVQGTLRSTSALALNRGKFRSAKLSAERVSFVSAEDYDVVPATVRSYLTAAAEAYPEDCGPTGYKLTCISSGSGGSGGGGSGSGGGPSSGAGGSKSASGVAPDPVMISWEGEGSSIFVSADPLFAEPAKEASITLSSSSASIYNLIPGKRYYFQVRSSDGAIEKELCIRPLGPLRLIKMGSVPNVRDLGGWTGEDGRTIAYGKLYRGYNIDAIGNARSVFLGNLGIAADMDLRGYDGNGTPSNPLSLSGEYYINIRLQQFMVSGSQYGVTADLYIQAIRYIIMRLSAGEPVYFHCIGGADRTGTLAFLIEALLGVSESDLSQEYELTSFHSTRLRTDTSSRPFKTMVVNYLYGSFWHSEDDTIQDIVTRWAQSVPGDPLTDSEIRQLKDLLLE